jgi:branched-chain amino acid transport system substrate-binding protein
MNMLPRAGRVYAFFLFALALSACSSAVRGPEIGRLPQLTSDNPQAEADMREAQGLADHGKRTQAIVKYRAFLHAHPDDRLVPLAQLALGRLLLDQHQDGEALALFNSVSEHPEPAVAEQGRFYAGVANERLGNHAEAADVLEPMLGRTIEPAETQLLLRTLAAAYAALNRYADAIRVLSSLLNEKLPERELASTRKRMIDLIDHKAGAADVRRLLDELDKQSFAFRQTVVRALRDADSARDTARARELVELLQEQHIPLDAELAAIALRAQSTGDADPNAIGAILPLSGRARRVGELALRGLMLAANLPPNGPAAPGSPSLIFRDDGGDPARAAQAVEELATVHRVIAIIGPLDGQSALAAGKRAQELGLPLISLSPAADVTSQGNLLFRYFPTADAEARALVASAKARKVESYAVLRPDTAYGQTMSEAFRKQAALAGLQLVSTSEYAAGATSFGHETEQLAKSHFDALFVPDTAPELGSIAAALAAAGMWSSAAGEHAPNNARAIALLAPSIAFDPGLPRLAGRYLQGARFAVPFDPQSADGAARSFVEQFQQKFGSAPDAFAAFAHDAYALVRASVKAGALTRAGLATQLGVQRAAEFVAPGGGFDQDREALHPVEVMELSGSGFVPVR